MSIRVIVADDEPVARRRLVRLLQETGRAEVVAECGGGEDSVAKTIALEPQLLFLDVQMPDLDGFEVIAALGNRDRLPAIVFVTAFDQYALRAFEVHAVDYLLKPYDATRFREAFDRAVLRIGARGGADEETRLRELLREYLEARGAGPPPLERIGVTVDGVLRIVQAATVDWVETEGNYLRLHVGPASYVLRETAANFETKLPRQFVRIHRRFIVNVDRVVEVQPWFNGDGVVVLGTGAKLRMSRTYRERLHARLL